MTIPALPIFDHPVDWAGGVVQTLEFLTNVITSKSGTEQRRALRTSPRRMFEATFILKGVGKSRFSMGVRTVGMSEWLVPIWPEFSIMPAETSSGAQFLVFDTRYADYQTGGYAYMVAPDGTKQAVELTNVVDTYLALAAPLNGVWPAGTRVYPLHRARFTDMPTITRKTQTIDQAQVRFEMSEPSDMRSGYDTMTPATPYGYPILAASSEQSNDLNYVTERMVETLDGQTGLISITDTAQRAFSNQDYAWLAFGRADYAKLKGFFYQMFGRLKAVWVPTNNADFQLVVQPTAGSNLVQVANCGYTDFGGPSQPGRANTVWQFKDGSSLYFGITGSINLSDTVEQLTLDAPIPSAFSLSDLRQISFMNLSRLASDTIELQHQTNIDGITTATVTFRNSYEDRVAT